MLGEPVYKMGETASECVRESEEFKGLCAPGDSDTNSSANTAYIQQNLVVMVCVYIIATAFANNRFGSVYTSLHLTSDNY